MPVNRREVGIGLGAAMLAAAPLGARAAAPATYRIYVGSYTVPKGKAAGIVCLSLDRTTGQMTRLSEAPGVNPSWLAVSRDRRFLYASNEISDYQTALSGSATAYAILPDGRLLELNRQPSGGVSPAACALDSTGRYLIAGNFRSGHFAVLPIDSDGRLGLPGDRVVRTQPGPHVGRQAGPHAHHVAVHPVTGELVFVDLGADGVDFYALEPNGRLRSLNKSLYALPGAGPRHMAFSKDGAFAYVANEIHNSVGVYRTPTGPGEARPLALVPTLPAGYRNGAASLSEIAVHPDGRFLCVANRVHNTLAVFEIDPKTGLLGPPRFHSTEGDGTRNFAFTPDGAMVVVGNMDSDTVVSMRFNRETGEITTLSKIDVLTPACHVFA